MTPTLPLGLDPKVERLDRAVRRFITALYGIPLWGRAKKIFARSLLSLISWEVRQYHCVVSRDLEGTLSNSH